MSHRSVCTPEHLNHFYPVRFFFLEIILVRIQKKGLLRLFETLFWFSGLINKLKTI